MKVKHLAFTTIKTVVCTVCRWLLVEVTCMCSSGIVELLLIFIKNNQNHCVVFLIVFTLVHYVLLALAHDLWGSHWFYRQRLLEALKLAKGTRRQKLAARAPFLPSGLFWGILSMDPSLQSQRQFYLSLNVVSVFLNHLRAL